MSQAPNYRCEHCRSTARQCWREAGRCCHACSGVHQDAVLRIEAREAKMNTLLGVPYCTDDECCDPKEREAFIRDKDWLDPNTLEWAGRCTVCLRSKDNHSIHCVERV